MRKLKIWLHSSNSMKQHYKEAFCELFQARLLLLRLPFKHIAPTLGDLDQCGDKVSLDQDVIDTLAPVAKSIKVVAKYVPWQSKCLVQAIAAKNMLQKRGVETTLYLGVVKNGSEMKAHAWTRTGPYFITGGNGENSHTVVRTFYNKPQKAYAE